MWRHIIVSLESIECVESHRWPNKNAGTKLREYGARQKDRPIAATVKRKLLPKGKHRVRKNTGLCPLLPDLILRNREAASRRMNGMSRASWFETALKRLLTMRVWRDAVGWAKRSVPTIFFTSREWWARREVSLCPPYESIPAARWRRHRPAMSRR